MPFRAMFAWLPQPSKREQEKAAEAERAAATTIQRHYKGHKARKDIKEEHASASRIQRVFRRKQNKKRDAAPDWDESTATRAPVFPRFSRKVGLGVAAALVAFAVGKKIDGDRKKRLRRQRRLKR